MTGLFWFALGMLTATVIAMFTCHRLVAGATGKIREASRMLDAANAAYDRAEALYDNMEQGK